LFNIKGYESITTFYKNVYACKLTSEECVDILYNFLKETLKFENVLNDIRLKNKIDMEYFVNKKIMLIKLFANTILGNILEDIRVLLMNSLRK
jgi:hypothetical protein